jgi:competence protein ComEC
VPRSGWLAVGAATAALALSDAAASVRIAALLALGATALVSTLLPRGRRGSVLAVAIAGGAVAMRLLLVPTTPLAVDPPDGRGPWTMDVEAVGAPREGDQRATLRLVTPPGRPIFRVSATLPRYPAIAPGDRVVVEGRLRPRPETPFGTYLGRIGAWGTLDADRLEVPETGTPGPALEDIRRGAGDALTMVLPEPEAGLAAGILIGLRDRVDRDVASAFTTAGVSHVVAISGWNIAIVAAAIGAVAGRLGRRRRAVVTILAIVAYVAFAGASPSVLRAGAMAGVVLLARETGRAGRAPAALGWAAAGLLVADPALVGDAGFQLSTLATAGLIAWGSAATERIDRWTHGRAPRWLAESLGVSLAAQLATLPIVVASFGRVALVAPAVNLAVVPLVAPVMAGGLVALAGGLLVGAGVPAGVGALLALPAWVGMRLMIAIIDVAAGLPGASLTVEPPWDAGLAIAITAAIAGIVMARRRPGRARDRRAPPTSATPAKPARGAPSGRAMRLAALTLVVAVACLGAIAASRPAGVARLTVLDVGQGDAILVEGSNGGRLLVDGGPDPDRLLVELDRRIPPWDRRLDAVVLSHPHEDHVAGLALLLERYRVGRTFEPGMLGPGPGYAAWAAELAGRPALGSLLAAGDRLAVDDIALEVLWPVRGSVPRTPPDSGTGINNVSIVLLGSVEGRRFLLTGDVEEEVDPDLLGRVGHVDLLKIAHHGSRTASTDAFLDAADPTIAVASAGAGNPYGHPSRATLDRVEARGARVFRTDRDGSVTIAFDPTGITVRSSGGRPRPTPRPRQLAGTTGVVATAFLCAVPQRVAASDDRLLAPIVSAPAMEIRIADPSLYHRLDDGARQDRSRPAVALARTAGLAPSSLPRRRRGCRIPRRSDGTAGRTGRPRARRNGRTHARHRQGAAGDRSPPAAAPRPRFGALARGARPRRVGPGSRAPPGDAAAGRRLVRCLAARLASRRPHRRVRRQACRPAVGADGRPLRRLAAPLPGRLGR